VTRATFARYITRRKTDLDENRSHFIYLHLALPKIGACLLMTTGTMEEQQDSSWSPEGMPVEIDKK